MGQDLPPLPDKVGVFPQYISDHTETIVLKEKIFSLTGDSFDIAYDNGQPFLKVEGKVFSLGGRKAVYDAQTNEHVFDIVKEHFHLLHTTYALQDPDGNKFFEVKDKMSLFGSKQAASFKSAGSGKDESIFVKGNFMDTEAFIVDNDTGNTVGRINRKWFNAREALFDKQSYAVDVAPGADKALLAALCICLDEKRNDTPADS